jgi:hypothetical protein
MNGKGRGGARQDQREDRQKTGWSGYVSEARAQVEYVGRIGVRCGSPACHDDDQRDCDEDREEHGYSVSPLVTLPSICGSHLLVASTAHGHAKKALVTCWIAPFVVRWARQVLNLRPLACEASALPLSYAPGSPLTIPTNELSPSSDKVTAARARVVPPSV